jgi:hypothetical protein
VRFEFRAIPDLPRLAWAARVRRDDTVVTVFHGPWVETWDDGFVEGAWDGPFTAGRIDRSGVLAGSGGQLVPGGVRFATPTNMYERLQSVRTVDALFVSNSLAFLLSLSGDRLDPGYSRYYLDLLAFYRTGIRRKRKRLRLDGGRAVDLHDCCNLDVARDLAVTRVEKPWGPPPVGVDDYLALLERTLREVVENAGDARRLHAYRALAMISQGYDSTAVAALARRVVRCGEAVTFLRSNSPEGYVDDSGLEIARDLGYVVATYERNDHAAAPGFRAEEFYLEPWGVDRHMVVMEERLVGALLLSGRSGETVWTRGRPRRWGLPDLQHALDATPGCALGEYRLRTGFLHFPLATVAAIHAPTIHPWNASPEMAPWSIGGRYDKPIARRIVEAAGVPRERFGQLKKGGQEREPPDPALRARVLRWLAHVTRLPRRREWFPRGIGDRLHPRWREGSFDVQHGVERMVQRYRRAMEAA